MLDYDKIKFLIIGDSSTGKTSLLQRYINDSFSPEITTTIGVDYSMKIMEHENIIKKVYIWDTAGQEKFRNMCQAYYRNCNGVFLVFDVTNRSSYNNVYYWLTEINKNTPETIIYLIANKCDLEEERCVTSEEIRNFAKINRLKHFEISVKNNINVDSVFQEMYCDVCQIIKNTPKTDIDPTIILNKSKKTSCCR